MREIYKKDNEDDITLMDCKILAQKYLADSSTISHLENDYILERQTFMLNKLVYFKKLLYTLNIEQHNTWPFTELGTSLDTLTKTGNLKEKFDETLYCKIRKEIYYLTETLEFQYLIFQKIIKERNILN